MSDMKDGGPAFPQSERVGDVSVVYGGMTLRDWFAGQVMTGLVANPHNKDSEGGNAFARTAYQVADAMLAARGGK